MHKEFPLPVTEFPLPEELSTAKKDSCHCQKKREATARKIALLSMSRRNYQSKRLLSATITLSNKAEDPVDVIVLPLIRVPSMLLDNSWVQRKKEKHQNNKIELHLVVDHLDGIWRKYTPLGLIWRRNGQVYRPTPNLLKDCAYKVWRWRYRQKQCRRDLSSGGVKKLTTALGHNRLIADLGDSIS
uniref:Uncharacterized protein n=1 Tax=Tanacetum cinerariifolium TaxID=118510 RepID=A0A6L2LMX5_TANCI|nr:hypothetical protein [Tanacetum cinerariifolium]